MPKGVYTRKPGAGKLSGAGRKKDPDKPAKISRAIRLPATVWALMDKQPKAEKADWAANAFIEKDKKDQTEKEA